MARTQLAEKLPATQFPDGYVARMLCQVAILPITNTGDDELWTRINGAEQLTVTRGSIQHGPQTLQYGLPYGGYPRLILAWLATAAVRTKTRTIPIPPLRRFLTQLGISPSPESKRDVTDQFLRLLTCRLQYTHKDDQSNSNIILWQFTSSVTVCLQLDGGTSWPSSVELSQEFYDAVMKSAVPYQTQIISALRGPGSWAMPVDVYWWLQHRTHNLKTPARISWTQLQGQFGGQYGPDDAHKWRARFVSALERVLVQTPHFVVTWDNKIVTVYPSKKPLPTPDVAEVGDREEISSGPPVSGIRIVHG